MNKWKLYIPVSVILLLSSCLSESVISETPENNDASSYLSVTSVELQRVVTYAGEMNDFAIDHFRILAFDGGGQCVSNVLYNAGLNEIIKHPIDTGTYDFMFLTNEPDDAVVKAQLDNLSVYGDLDNIAYPASSFRSDTLIPMMQEIKNIQVLKGGVAKTDNNILPSPIPLNLERMGVRLDVTLKAVENPDGVFTGVTFSGVPDKVPLTANYAGVITRNRVRSFTLAENSEHYSDTTVSESDIVWAKNIKRIILPANKFTPENDKNNATVFTIDMGEPYNPSCELKIGPDDYTLPRNSKLKLIATINMPLELIIEASPWTEVDADWNTNYRILNVSQIEANITDYNGVRISFWSNMPIVRVLPEVYVGASGMETASTNEVFNNLAVTDDSHSTTRFFYDPTTGSGYMDILVDTVNTAGNHTYRLILSGEEIDGTNVLQREIKINVSQLGVRPDFNSWGDGCVGVFFRNNETGERVVDGQHMYSRDFLWHAWIESGEDFIVLSSTPSFDPEIGTDHPGDPELYPVLPNLQKGENGSSIDGAGRIYFRVGLKSKNTTGAPRYGTIYVRYQLSNDGWWETNAIYVRQGEDADYIWRPDDIIEEGPLSGRNRTAARKFSPYNLTAQAYKNGNAADYHQLNVKGGVFVDYPSQAGALFQWAVDKEMLPEPDYNALVRRAYHPMATLTNWIEPYFEEKPLLWDPAEGYGFKADFEICPEGYSRPSDGPVDTIAFNGLYDDPGLAASPDTYGDYSHQIVDSEFRNSLLRFPRAGNGYKDSVAATYPTVSVVPGTLMGYYADGFYDRRPIRANNNNVRTVSTNNADAAFVGILFYNERTNASVFFPSVGRRHNKYGTLEYQTSSGYYWSSSAAPWYPKIGYGAWGFETSYWNLQPVTSLASFAQSVRCVKD